MIVLLTVLVDVIVAWVVMLLWPALIDHTGIPANATISFWGAVVLVLFVRFLTIDTRLDS